MIDLLAGKTCLSDRVAIYVPSTIDVNKSIDSSLYVERVADSLATLFGGCTSMNVDGYYMSDRVGLVGEKVTIVYSYVESINNDVIASLLDICESLKLELNQECISLEMQGKLYFI